MESVFSSVDLLAMIVVRLCAARDRARCRIVCKAWCRIISTDRAPLLWGGAAGYAEFTLFMESLPEHTYRMMCADGIWTIDTALRIARTPYPPPRGEIYRLIRVVQPSVRLDFWIALQAGVIALDHVKSNMTYYEILPKHIFKNKHNTRALHKHILTTESMAKTPLTHLLWLLDTKYGGLALEEYLITLDEIAEIQDARHIMDLFNNPSIIEVLRRGETRIRATFFTYIDWTGGFSQIHTYENILGFHF